MASQQGGRYTGVGFIDKGIEHMVNFFSDQCKMPGCNKQCYVENNGRVHDFCSRTHATQFKAMKDAEKQQQVVRGKRLNAVQHGQSSGGYGGWSGQHSAAACHYGTSGPSCTRSGTPYGPYPIMVNQPAMITNHCGDPGHGPIRFYNRDEPYYGFTNFYPAPIDLDGKIWPTTEHYFQAQKFIGTSYLEMIRNFDRPRQAFDLSRNPTVSRWRRSDWEDIKINIMRKALLAKFTQHKNLRQMLLSTGDRYLIEHSPHDKFWGNGGDDTGENHLGLLLMEVRQVLINLQTSLYMQEETVVLTQPKITPDSHRERVQRSESTEKDGQSRRSSSSSSSMEYTNAEVGHSQGQSHQVPENEDPQKNNLIRPPLHPMATEGQQLATEGEGSPQTTPASSGTAPPPTQKPKDPTIVDDLIDLTEPEHAKEDQGNPLMEYHDSSKLPQPIVPMSVSNQPECTAQASDTSTDAGKVSSSSNEGDQSEEQMDTV